MNVIIIATKNCSHCHNFSKELNELAIEHDIIYAEENPDLCRQLAIRHSPNLVVDGNVIFRRQPSEAELKLFFKKIKAIP